MREGLYLTESPQGEITGIVYPDHDELADRRENAASSQSMINSYPGGSDPSNLYFIPGELVLGNRESHVYNTNGEPNEHGFTSLNGKSLYAYDGNLEQAMRNTYFQGIAKTEYMVDSVNQGESAVTVLKAGSCSIVNNGHQDIYAGDLLEWYFPNLDGSDGMTDRPIGTDTSIAYRNRGGQPFTKILPEVRRYNPYRNETSVAAISARLSDDDKTETLFGIRDLADITPEMIKAKLNMAGNNYERIDPVTEEAFGVLYFLKKLSRELGDVDIDTLFDAINVLMGAIASAQRARKDRVFAKAMSTAGPSETVHIMVSHFSLI